MIRAAARMFRPVSRCAFDLRALRNIVSFRDVLRLSVCNAFMGARLTKVRLTTSKLEFAIRVGRDQTDIAVLEQVFAGQQYNYAFGCEPQVVIDAGANVGISTAWFATKFPSARVIAIEPDEENYDLLVRNTSHLSNVEPINAALWRQSERVVIHDRGTGPWGYQVSADPSPETRRSVPSVTVDDIVRRVHPKRIGILKMDIEGAEIEVMNNAVNWIGSVEAVIAELHDRLRPGCSRAFFCATAGFSGEAWRGETVMVSRAVDGVARTNE